jgi:hypothetical protein
MGITQSRMLIIYSVSHLGEVRGAGVEPLRGGTLFTPLCTPLP